MSRDTLHVLLYTNYMYVFYLILGFSWVEHSCKMPWWSRQPIYPTVHLYRGNHIPQMRYQSMLWKQVCLTICLLVNCTWGISTVWIHCSSGVTYSYHSMHNLSTNLVIHVYIYLSHLQVKCGLVLETSITNLGGINAEVWFTGLLSQALPVNPSNVEIAS